MLPITHATQTWSSKIQLAGPLIVSHMTPEVPHSGVTSTFEA